MKMGNMETDPYNLGHSKSIPLADIVPEQFKRHQVREELYRHILNYIYHNLILN